MSFSVTPEVLYGIAGLGFLVVVVTVIAIMFLEPQA